MVKLSQTVVKRGEGSPGKPEGLCEGREGRPWRDLEKGDGTGRGLLEAGLKWKTRGLGHARLSGLGTGSREHSGLLSLAGPVIMPGSWGCWRGSSFTLTWLLCSEFHGLLITPTPPHKDSDNPDLRDRGYIYWRLLSTDPVAAKEVVLAEKPLISEETDLIEPTLLDELICYIGTLASVYHKPPSAFVEGGRGVVHKSLPPRTAS